MAASKFVLGLWITAMLVFGTATAICAKSMFQTCATGNDGKVMEFNRPWMQTMLMFCAMTLALFVHHAKKCFEAQENTGEYAMLQDGNLQNSQEKTAAWKLYVYIMVPSVFDLFATTLAGCGLLWVDASVYQMLRGSLMIFSAGLSIIFLGKRLKGFHWLGISITVMAVVLVGIASVESSKDEAGQSVGLEILGIILIVCGQLVQASQMVVEEVLLKNFKAPAMVIVGMEGVWGVLWMVVLMLILQYTPGYSDSCMDGFVEQCADPDNAPAEDQSCSSVALYHEDTMESLDMIGSSSTLYTLTGIYLFAILMYNVSGMNVTKNLTAIHRTILEACRTLCIWLVQLFINYVVKWEGHGETWNDWSYLQAFGFVLLIIGTLTYNKIIQWPFLHYDPPKNKKKSSLPNVRDLKASPRVANAFPNNATPVMGQQQQQQNWGAVNDSV